MKLFENIVGTVTNAFGLKSYFYHQSTAKSRWDNAGRLEHCLDTLRREPVHAKNVFYNSELESLNSAFQWHKQNLDDTYFLGWYVNQFHLPVGRAQLDETQLAKVLWANARTLRFESRKEKILSYIMPVVSICLFPLELCFALLTDINFLALKLLYSMRLSEYGYVSESTRKEHNYMLEKEYEMSSFFINLPIAIPKYLIIILPINLMISAAHKITDLYDPHKRLVVNNVPPSNASHQNMQVPENSSTIRIGNDVTPSITLLRDANRSDGIGGLWHDSTNNIEQSELNETAHNQLTM